MGYNTQLAIAALEAEANALALLFNGGWLDIMSGDQPNTGDELIQNQLVLVSLNFGNPAFLPAVGGVITSYPDSIVSGTAINTGDATWFRTYKNNHVTRILDGSIGVLGMATNPAPKCNLGLPETLIYAGESIAIEVFVHDISKATLGS